MFRVTERPENAILGPLDNQVTRKDDPLPTGNHLNWVISGRKGSGKTSVLLSSLMDAKSPWHKHYSSIHIISPTAHRDPKFQPLLDDIEQSGQGAHYEELSNETVDEILSKVNELNEKHHTKKHPMSHLCVIDDCIHLLPSSQTRKGPTSRVNQLFVNNRHSKLTNIITTQQYKKINPLIRANMDLVTLFPTENAKEIESIASDFNLDHDKFVNMLEFATNEPNSFLHVNLFGHKPTYYKKFNRIEI
jgi:hypothetical protein